MMKLHQDSVNRPGGAMGAVIMFPRVRRGSCETQPPMADVSAAVIILPAIRIERTYDAPPAIETKATRSPSGRKRAAPRPALARKRRGQTKTLPHLRGRVGMAVIAAACTVLPAGPWRRWVAGLARAKM